MAGLSIRELEKYGWRVQLFIDKVNKGDGFVTVKDEVVHLDLDFKKFKKNPKFDEFISEILRQTQKTSKVTKGGAQIVFKLRGSSKVIKLTDLKKTKEFGGGSAVKNSSSDKTTLQEVGFLVALDMLLQGQKNIDNYVPSSRMKVKADIKDVVLFLKENHDWMSASFYGATTVFNKFRGALKSYTFHHDDETFNSIRKTGKKLSGLSNEDKWNPSDVYLIKKYAPDTSNIVAFNEYIDRSGDIIGLSLKKGEKEALHGSVAANVILKKFGYSGVSVKYKENNQEFRDDMINLLNKIKSNKFKEIYVHAPSANIAESLQTMNITSKNFWSSMPLSLEFFSKSDDLEHMISYGIMSAMSISPESCPHWKLEGAKLSKMPNKNNKLEIIRLRLKLNGDGDCLIDFKFNGKQMKCQLRSKGSLPQFIIIKTAENPNNLIKLSSMK